MKTFIFLTLNSFKSNYAHKMWPTWTRLDQQVWRKRINAVIYSTASTIRAVPLMWHASRPSSTWVEMHRVEFDVFDEGVVEYEWVPTNLKWDHPHYGLDYYKCFLVIDKNGKERGMFPCPWALNIGLIGLNTEEIDRQYKLSVDRAKRNLISGLDW